LSRIQRVTFGLNRRRVVEATRTWTFSPLLQPTGFQPVVVEFLDERMRYFHGVWHLFVLAGSVFHYLTILLFVAK